MKTLMADLCFLLYSADTPHFEDMFLISCSSDYLLDLSWNKALTMGENKGLLLFNVHKNFGYI